MSTASVAEPLKRTLAAKHEFIRTSLKAGKVPTGPMLASFLQALVHEMGPHVKASPPALQEFLKSGLASLGWNVATNSAAPGSAPPHRSGLSWAFWMARLLSARRCRAHLGTAPLWRKVWRRN